MGNTADNVIVATTGGAYVAETGSDLPTDTTSDLDVAFDEVGYISESGLVEGIGESFNKIKAWQNADVVRTVQTEHDLTYKLTMIETNETTLETFYGNYADGVVEIRGGQLPRKSWVFNVIDGDSKIRVVVPDAQVIERGDVSYVNGDPVGYEITIECYPDDDGVKAYKYLATNAISA